MNSRWLALALIAGLLPTVGTLWAQEPEPYLLAADTTLLGRLAVAQAHLRGILYAHSLDDSVAHRQTELIARLRSELEGLTGEPADSTFARRNAILWGEARGRDLALQYGPDATAVRDWARRLAVLRTIHCVRWRDPVVCR